MICPTCPWRRSSTVGGGDIPRFSIEKMRDLADTVGAGDAIRPVMACHGSVEGGERPCGGYLAVEGYSNIACRLMVIEGRLPDEAFTPPADVELWPSFDLMLAAYEAAQPPGDNP